MFFLIKSGGLVSSSGTVQAHLEKKILQHIFFSSPAEHQVTGLHVRYKKLHLRQILKINWHEIKHKL